MILGGDKPVQRPASNSESRKAGRGMVGESSTDALRVAPSPLPASSDETSGDVRLSEAEWSDVFATLPEAPESALGWELSLVRRTVERILRERMALGWDEGYSDGLRVTDNPYRVNR